MIDERIAHHMAHHLNTAPHGGAAVPSGTYKPRKGGGATPALQHALLPKVLRVIRAGVTPYLHGPAGSGKTTIAEQCATALGLEFYGIGRVDDSFSLTGFVNAQGEYMPTSFYLAFRFGGVFLADEMDRWNIEAVTCINAPLSNGYALFPGVSSPIPMHENFVFIAAGNTLANGPSGTYTAAQQHDAAFMSRFVKIGVEYDTDLERAAACGLAQRNDTAKLKLINTWVDRVQTMRRKAGEARLNVVISPRDSIHGARLIMENFSLPEVAEMTVYAGLTPAQINQLGGDI
jgi:MoxR-like ATPase